MAGRRDRDLIADAPPRPTLTVAGPAAPAFYANDGLHIGVYDQTAAEIPGGDDIGFFLRLARETGDPILELGCGTARIAARLAEAGHRVVGLDLSAAMLNAATRRRAGRPAAARRRPRLVEADMADHRLAIRFGLAFPAYRVFQALPDPERQLDALACARRHLRPGGLLVLDLFDPRLDLLASDGWAVREVGEFRHATTGRRVDVDVLERVTDPI